MEFRQKYPQNKEEKKKEVKLKQTHPATKRYKEVKN